MSVWVCMPSKRPASEAQPILDLWQQRGYRTAVLRDQGDEEVRANLLWWSQTYAGWGDAVNLLARMVFSSDLQCSWIVAAADDIEPDPTHASDDIAEQCSAHFLNQHIEIEKDIQAWSSEDRMRLHEYRERGRTFGVMQPTGDRFAGGSIDRICGSPWLGREFCRRMYQGRGPFFPEYRHMFVDEELQEVAQSLGVLWQRPDLVHLHLHFTREHRGLNSNAIKTDVPEHLAEANSREHWDKYKALFLARKAANFPGHQPIA